MTEQTLLKVVVQKAQFNEPAASYVLSLQYAEFQAMTSASAISTIPVFVDQPLYLPFQPGTQSLQCKAFRAGEGPPLEIAVGNCTWNEEDGNVQRKSVVLQDQDQQEIGTCKLMMHPVGCGIADAVARTIASASWLSVKCLAFPTGNNPDEMQITCAVGQREASLTLQFEEGVCHTWTPVRALAPAPRPAPESNDMPGYRAVITLNASAEETRVVVFSGLNLGEPQLVRLLLSGRLWLLELCIFSSTSEQLYMIEQLSTSPLPDGCVLIASPLQQEDVQYDSAHTDMPSVGGIVSLGSRTFITGWQHTDGLVASAFEFQSPTELLRREQSRAILHDADVVDPTRELHFKLQAAEDVQQQLLQELSICLRSVTRRTLTPTTSAPQLEDLDAGETGEPNQLESGADEEKAAITPPSIHSGHQNEPESDNPPQQDANGAAQPLDADTNALPPTATEEERAETIASRSASVQSLSSTSTAAAWTREKQSLQAELKRKQNMVDRLLVEFQRRGEALEQCGEEMHRLRLEKSDAVKSLKVAKSELRKSRGQSEQQLKAVVTNAFGHELSADNANVQDLRQVIRALADRLAVVDEERMELKRSTTEAKATKTAHAILQKQFKELQAAHLQQAAQLQRLHSFKEKVAKYQETIVMQEKVIARLQAYLAHFTGQRSTTDDAVQTDLSAGGATPTPLDEQLLNESISAAATRTPLLVGAELRAACEAKDHRIAALEKQLVQASRNASREISELKMQLFDMELKLVMASVPDGETSAYPPVASNTLGLPSSTGFDVQRYLELPAIASSVPSLSQHAVTGLSARSLRRNSQGSFDADFSSHQIDLQQRLSARSSNFSPKSAQQHLPSGRQVSPTASQATQRTPQTQTDATHLRLPAKEAWEVGMPSVDALSSRSEKVPSSRRLSRTSTPATERLTEHDVARNTSPDASVGATTKEEKAEPRDDNAHRSSNAETPK